jgi:hypothetical protein
MNDRLYEIINQCFIGTTDGKLSELNTVKNVEKFAELIVQECADIALKSGNIANKNISAKIESERIYHKIMNHFGD